LIGVLLKQKGAGQSIYSRTRGRSTLPSVKASAQIMEPERWPDETALPLAQFATTYAHGDDHYDLSFTIESARREFLGECGVGISATTTGRKRKPDSAAQSETSEKMPSADDALTFLAKLARGKEDQLRTQAQQEAETRMDEIMGHKSKAEAAPEIPAWLSSTGTTPDKGKPVTALEMWIFDKNDINTVTKVLRSTHGFYEPAARSSRDPVNDVLVIEPDQMVVLETKTLRLRVKVLAVEYASDLAYSSGVFKQVNLKLAVWSK
ncbi:MAG TPA: hypothetical protein VLG46_04490, partial [Anaerolineae bacterium]|nr:hypothetical protein [Anaerolineae bacterium]